MMERDEWESLYDSLVRTRDEVASLPSERPNPAAQRCQYSRHRTLAHLRACQEQWLYVVSEFLARQSPNVKILHPLRKFDHEGYIEILWGDHMSKFLEDRATWLELRLISDWNRGGKMNGKPESVATLTRRLALHEVHHLALIRNLN